VCGFVKIIKRDTKAVPLEKDFEGPKMNNFIK